MTLRERFEIKVDKRDGPHACWPWTAARLKSGYGTIRDGRQRRHLLAHRAAWLLAYGPIPSGICVLHRCDVPSCVNPEHLFLGTLADNNADMRSKGRGKNPPTHRGKNNASAKLNGDSVLEIRRRAADGEPQRAIARAFGVTKSTVADAIRFRSWAYVRGDSKAPADGAGAMNGGKAPEAANQGNRDE